MSSKSVWEESLSREKIFKTSVYAQGDVPSLRDIIDPLHDLPLGSHEPIGTKLSYQKEVLALNEMVLPMKGTFS